jgi:acyl-CoA thioester hydrolase
VSCTFKAPLRFNDTAEVRLLVKEVRRMAVIYQFQFRKADTAGHVLPDLIAEGEVVAVCVTAGADGRMVAQPIPADVRAKIEVAPELAAKQ